MTTLTIPELLERIEYPESDGLPMSDNTKQWNWMVLIKEGLEVLFQDRPDVFVAGNLLWYPHEGDNRFRVAPDVFVAFGRPKGDRGSYLQWKEGDLPPHVVFEVLSPGNTHAEILEKIDLYDELGVEEFYIYDPDRETLRGFHRRDNEWTPIAQMQGWVSPRLAIRFGLEAGQLVLEDPAGNRFVSTVERARRQRQAEAHANQAEARADQAVARADQEDARADQEEARADQADARAQQLAARLRALGIDPDAISP